MIHLYYTNIYNNWSDGLKRSICIKVDFSLAEATVSLRVGYYDSPSTLSILIIAGIQHQGADALSRLNTKERDVSGIDDDIPVLIVTTRTRPQQEKHGQSAPDKILKKSSGLYLSTLEACSGAQSTYANCYK